MKRMLASLLAVALTGAVAAVVLVLALTAGRSPQPFIPAASVTKITSGYPSCTPAFGQCQVQVFRFHHRWGIVSWTCFVQPPVKPGASNVWVAVNDCFRP